MQSNTKAVQVTVPFLKSLKNKRKITALTAYDFTMAALIDQSAVDFILVGDSAATVVQGFESTLPITLDEMIYHAKCVKRATKRALVVGDLPFMSYQISPAQALESAGRMLKEAGVSAVKLEGGISMQETISRIVDVDIPVMGHIGLTPQSYHRMGGHKVQGKVTGITEKKLIAGSRERIIEDALAIQEAGAFAIVIEAVPEDLAAEISGMLEIPTIGIGAGSACDGQILVINDMLGMQLNSKPKFVKQYADLNEVITGAIGSYIDEVQQGIFPGTEFSFQSKTAKMQR